jgi:hypothetical protein
MKNYVKSAQFAAILVAIFAWTGTLTFYKASGEVLLIFLVFACIITMLIPFCSTEPDNNE